MEDNTVTTAPGRAADAAVERAFTAAVRDPGQVTGLLDELSRGRLWLPLADDGQPVTDGSAVNLPALIYLGGEFVPAFTSAQRLLDATESGPATDAELVPHVIVPAAALARLLPTGVGIALNPGGAQSVPVFPEGVAYLAAPRACDLVERISVGPPPEEPAGLLGALRFGLRQIGAAREAATAWLSADAGGQGLVISVALDDPADPVVRRAVLDVVEQAASAAPEEREFPIDVTFPGEGEPDLVDEWVARSAAPFYSRA
jgi:hypothetical protein